MRILLYIGSEHQITGNYDEQLQCTLRSPYPDQEVAAE